MNFSARLVTFKVISKIDVQRFLIKSKDD